MGWFFNAYLREADLPTLLTERDGDLLTLRRQVPGDRAFPMPVPVRIDGTTTRVEIENGEARLEAPAGSHVIVDPGMRVLRRLPIIGTCEEIKAERESKEDRP